MSSYGENAGLAIADRKIRQAQEENEKLRVALGQWQRHSKQLQHDLEEQIIETARIGVLRVVILDELLKINPDHWLKDKEKRVALANDKRLVAKEVTEMGRPDLVDRV